VLKSVGEFPLEVALHADVVATVTVVVVGEQ
ncbi:MAG: 50S ribosomal protein L9, partial [Burkholderiaceae bacterium]|nr:50S ribosomal protein L9 [Burkholderiaceae bacterium]